MARTARGQQAKAKDRHSLQPQPQESESPGAAGKGLEGETAPHLQAPPTPTISSVRPSLPQPPGPSSVPMSPAQDAALAGLLPQSGGS